MNTIGKLAHRLHDEEIRLLSSLRNRRRERSRARQQVQATELTFGAKVADAVAASVGSWPFIIIQSFVLASWMAFNVAGWVKAWDPYPFILLNLVLSFQAAYAAPFIMMSQNRQAALDRADARNDYDINIKAELEIELLHEKLDLMRETEILELIRTIRVLEERISELSKPPAALPGMV